jgi:hypothetical protein
MTQVTRSAKLSSGVSPLPALHRCPLADVADVHPETVCELHLGLAEGLAEGLGGLTVERLAIKKAHRAGCRLTMIAGEGS